MKLLYYQWKARINFGGFDWYILVKREIIKLTGYRHIGKLQEYGKERNSNPLKKVNELGSNFVSWNLFSIISDLDFYFVL